MIANRWALAEMTGSSSLASSAKLSPAATTQTIDAPIHRGDNLVMVLDRAGVKQDQARAAALELSKYGQVAHLKAGETVKLAMSMPQTQVAAPAAKHEALSHHERRSAPTADLIHLDYAADANRQLHFDRDPNTGATQTKMNPREWQQSLIHCAGPIDLSLFESGLKHGASADKMIEMIHLFSYDVDFQRDIQPGDRFAIVYDRFTDKSGRQHRTGSIRYAALELSGTILRLYRFTGPDGQIEYFNGHGESIKKALLRTPVDGAQLTSSFGMRKHPLLGYTRMHRGVDFGAPQGSPVMAAGDGVVEMAGRNAGYGNYIRLRHTEDYETAYGHLSRFASYVRPGAHVHQGDVIGYVGMTGLATGPHLHYEVLVKDQQINPLAVRLPVRQHIDPGQMQNFRRLTAGIDRTLQAEGNKIGVASLDPVMVALGR